MYYKAENLKQKFINKKPVFRAISSSKSLHQRIRSRDVKRLLLTDLSKKQENLNIFIVLGYLMIVLIKHNFRQFNIKQIHEIIEYFLSVMNVNLIIYY